MKEMKFELIAFKDRNKTVLRAALTSVSPADAIVTPFVNVEALVLVSIEPLCKLSGEIFYYE